MSFKRSKIDQLLHDGEHDPTIGPGWAEEACEAIDALENLEDHLACFVGTAEETLGMSGSDLYVEWELDVSTTLDHIVGNKRALTEALEAWEERNE